MHPNSAHAPRGHAAPSEGHNAAGPLREVDQLGQQLEAFHGLAASGVLGHMASTLHGGDISFSQLNALFRLYRHGPQTIASLAEGADLSPTAASRMVEGLVRAGLAARQVSAEDRRRKCVELTAEGADRLSRLCGLMAGSYAKLLEPVPLSTLRQLQQALSEVSRYLPACSRTLVPPSDPPRN